MIKTHCTQAGGNGGKSGVLAGGAAALCPAVSTPWPAGGSRRYSGPHGLAPTSQESRLLSLQDEVMGKTGPTWRAVIQAPTGEGSSASLSLRCWHLDPY